jgi:hypothetical protein
MPSLSVTAPTTGTTWYKGTQYTISWATTGNVTWNNGWAVYLMDGGGTVDTIATGLASVIRSRSYTPSIELESDNDYYIFVSGQYTEGGP